MVGNQPCARKASETAVSSRIFPAAALLLHFAFCIFHSTFPPMSLSTAQRFGAYFTGFGLGCVLVGIYLSVRGLPHPPEAPPPGVIRRETPGALAQWMATGTPIDGDFVLSHDDNRMTGGADAATGRFTRAAV